MLITTTDYFENEDIEEYLGVVRAFQDNCNSVEQEMDMLIEQLIAQARGLGANAIVGLKFVGPSTYTSYSGWGTYPDLIAFGTAVRLS